MRRIMCAAAVLLISGGAARAAEMDAMDFTTVSIERLEHRWQDGGDAAFIEGSVTYGNDARKFVLEIEGERALDEGAWETMEVHALYRRPISAYFDVMAGVRHDLSPDPETTHLTVGVAGLLPQWVEIDARAYLSEEGDASLRVEAETDIRLTRRMFIQPLVELDVSGSDVPERELGAGFSKIEAGLRLHYEIERRFAPYIGVNYEAKLGETADYARAHGDDASAASLVAGLRFFY